MVGMTSDYKPLLSEEYEHGSPETCECHHQHTPSISWRREFTYLCALLVQFFLLLVALIYVLRVQSLYSSEGAAIASRLYSPAHEFNHENQIKVFADNFGVKTVYQEYSDESDQAWQDLYNRTMMKIPKDEARLLPNKTWPIKDSPGYYIAQLDVFHQLHCLNKIRQALRPDRYQTILNVTLELSDFHIAHCVDSIRQYVMCHADIAVVPWQWASEDGVSGVGPRLDYPHTCKNFDQILEWSQERYIGHYINATEYVEDDLPTPPIIY